MSTIKSEFKAHELADEAERWGKIYQNRTFAAKDELCHLLERFILFTKDYLEYFETNKSAQKLPRPWLSERIYTTLLEYWLPLAKVAEQYFIPEYAKRLDKITQERLPPLTANAVKISLPSPDVILYIDKLPQASYLYPYTGKSFIAMPWIADEEWESNQYEKKVLSLPHEIAHHIYWSLAFPGEPKDPETSKLDFPTNLRNELKNRMGNLSKGELSVLSKMLDGWAEEIFADVIATRILGDQGQQYLESAKQLVLRNCKDAKDLVYNDGTHPSAYVRPFIPLKTLGQNGFFVEQKTERSFIASLNNIQLPQTLYIKPNDEDKNKNKYTVKTVQTALEGCIEYINTLLDQGLKPIPEKIDSFEKLLLNVKKVHRNDSEMRINNILLSPQVVQAQLSWYCSTCQTWREFRCTVCGN